MVKKKKSFLFITTSRADYSHQRFLIKESLKSKKLNIKLLVSGSHFSKNFGNTFREIQKDQIKIDYKIKIKEKIIRDNNFTFLIRHLFERTNGILKKNNFDAIIIFGDRFEMLAIAYLAIILRIPIIHIYGGEITQGSTDDLIRHSITKLSNYHLVKNKIYEKRIIQLGENKKNVFRIGNLSLENISKLKLFSLQDLNKKLNLKLTKNNFIVITFHPETNTKNFGIKMIMNCLKVLDFYKDIKMIFTLSNIDNGSKEINKIIKDWSDGNKNSTCFNFVGTQNYLSLVKFSCGVIGNSSSLANEVSILKKYSLLIGTRQKGRILSKYNYVSNTKKSIQKNLDSMISKNIGTIKNLKIDKKKFPSKIFVKILEKINFKTEKKFHDIKI